MQPQATSAVDQIVNRRPSNNQPLTDGTIKNANLLIGCQSALEAFYKMNVTNMLDDKKFQQMQDIVDVYEYRDKLLMPKMVISTAGDEFFILDNSRFVMSFV